MTTRHNAGSEDRERETRIEAIKEQLQEQAGGQMVALGSGELPESEEKFWQRMRAFENGPFTTDFERLTRAGIELPQPDAMDDAALTAKLWQVLEQLGRMCVLVEDTDHLSDRELYSQLWHEGLREEVPDVPNDGGAYHLSMVGTGSEDQNRAYLKYYADERTRMDWLRDFPDEEIPPHEDPPHDRDRRLEDLYRRMDAEDDAAEDLDEGAGSDQ
jgi:hypothetical protein